MFPCAWSIVLFRSEHLPDPIALLFVELVEVLGQVAADADPETFGNARVLAVQEVPVKTAQIDPLGDQAGHGLHGLLLVADLDEHRDGERADRRVVVVRCLPGQRTPLLVGKRPEVTERVRGPLSSRR